MTPFDIIKTARLTEKGTVQSAERNQYTVVADRRANKTQIRQAVQELFKVKVIGVVNFGYVFALSQFFVSWGLAHYYAHVANKDFDRLTRELVDELK